jgi:hypothetical protein
MEVWIKEINKNKREKEERKDRRGQGNRKMLRKEIKART